MTFTGILALDIPHLGTRPLGIQNSSAVALKAIQNLVVTVVLVTIASAIAALVRRALGAVSLKRGSLRRSFKRLTAYSNKNKGASEKTRLF